MMTPLKMWCLLPFSVLFLFVTPTNTDVFHSMSECQRFFLNETPPQITDILNGTILDQNRYKIMCENMRSFVMLYDTAKRIPVFSAYKYRGEQEWKRSPNDKLESEHEDRNIRLLNRFNIYKHQPYNRGPFSHGFDETDKMSTEIVPEEGPFNQGGWNRMEKCIKCVMDKYCKNNNNNIEGFVVTGAQSNSYWRFPFMPWSAFCCYSSSMNTWLASANWGKSQLKQMKTLEELQLALDIQPFPRSECPLNKTVAEFHPDTDERCQCPPRASITSASTTPNDNPSSTLPHTTTATPSFSTVTTNTIEVPTTTITLTTAASLPSTTTTETSTSQLNSTTKTTTTISASFRSRSESSFKVFPALLLITITFTSSVF
ncbi:uncharacterized protein LOC113168644 [Anabas testudineus]|uniref:Uncharacterized protein n=1 Tax=Anabas testudineus TaxID=64144 RepID=A0A7N5ZUV3_ANATE|nr:uncharacterized protein LOC113168644 [Anabas testudineus]